MANYNIYVQHTGGAKTFPVIEVEYPENTVSGTGHTSGSPLELEIGDTLTFQNADTNVGPGNLVISSLSIFTDNNNITISAADTGTFVKTVASGGTTADTLNFDKTNDTGTATTNFFYVERQAAQTITAPTISGTTFLYYNNQPRALYELTDASVTYAASSFFVRTQINLSNNGQGGTLEYGRNTSSNNASGASWQTSGTSYNWPSGYPDQQDSPNAANQFNHLNNSTRYFFASQDRDTAGAFDSTGAVTYSHVNPNTVTVSNVSNVALSTTSVNVTINGCTTDSGGTMSDKSPNPISHAEVYSISKTDHGTTGIAISTVSGDRIDKVNSNGSTSISFNIPSADMPAQTAGASETYYVYAIRRYEWSGAYLYNKTDTFTITRTTSTSDPDIDVTETSGREITPGATSYTMTFSNGTSGDYYQLRHYDGGAQTGTIVDLLGGPSQADASGNFSFSLQSSDLPASGTADTKWYSLYAKRTIANGGSNTYFYCNGTTLVNTLNLTRRPSTPTLTISDDDAASANVGIIATISDPNSFTADRLVLVQYTGASASNPDSQTTALVTSYTGSGVYSGNFTQPRNTAGANYFYRAYLQKIGTTSVPENELTGSSFSDYDPSNGGNYQAGYIAPDLNIDDPTRTPSGDLASDYTGDVTINITGATINDTVRVVRTSPSTLDCADTGILTSTSGTVTLQNSVSGHLPPSGTTYTYKLRVKRAASKGGTDVYADTNPLRTFSITRSADNTPELYTNLAGDKDNAATSTYYYATFTVNIPGTTSPGTGFALGTSITNGTSISVSNGQWSTNGSTWSSSTSTVNQNQTVYFRALSSSSSATAITHSLTIGTVTHSFYTSTPGGGGGIGGGSGTYGLQVYDDNGTSLVLSPSTRLITKVEGPQTFSLAASGQSGDNDLLQTDMTDLTTSNSDVVFPNATSFTISVSRESNGFRLTNTSVATTFVAYVIRF
jgi:hypothetical protein